MLQRSIPYPASPGNNTRQFQGVEMKEYEPLPFAAAQFARGKTEGSSKM